MTALRAYRYGWMLLPVLVFSFLACSKVNVDLPTTVQTSDPDVSYIETQTVQLATQKLDSFTTQGRASFVFGNHTDPWIGHVTAESYAQISVPASNPVKDKTVYLDSICMLIRPNGLPYGDTTQNLSIRVFESSNPIAPYEGNAGSFYNTQQIPHKAPSLGGKDFVLRPTFDTLVSVRLSDALGQQWLGMLQRNDAEIQSTSAFVDFFRGICIGTDTTTTKTLYYFTGSKSGVMIRLYYHELAAIPTQKFVDFGYISSTQFSHIDIRHTGTPMAVFTPGKRELRGSEQTGNRAYLDATMGSYIKLTFPDVLKLKELHPYIQVIRAQLELNPTQGSYAYPYSLPPTLNLYTTDNYSDLGISVKIPNTSAAATGNLYIDQLYGKDTKYSYDITGYIQGVLAIGEFANKSLMLVPGSYAGFDAYKRLILNDQTLANGVKLKLYVLGL
jgi:hypothetical protein